MRGSRGEGAKSCFGQFRAVHGEIRVENFTTKMADNFVVNRLAWLHEVVRDEVCLNKVRAQRNEHLADN